jgi:L-fuculose-phosphate aldolase
MGFTSPVSGNHSIRIPKSNSWMWITPSGIPRYHLKEKDLIKVNLENGNAINNGRKPSIEWHMHALIYNKITKIKGIVHTHSPYTLGVATSEEKFCHIIEESKIVVGNPIIIPNKPSGSMDLAKTVSKAFEHGGNASEETRAVIIRNHGVVTVGNSIHQARAVVEALEEWAKIMTTSKIFGGPKYVFDK